MKHFKMARGLMVALAVGLAGSVVAEVPAGMKQYMPDTNNFEAFTKDPNPKFKEQAEKDMQEMKRRAGSTDGMNMLLKTQTNATAPSEDTGKGMEPYLPTDSSFKNATNTNLTKLSIGDLMKKGEACMDYNWKPVPTLQKVCCYDFRPCPKNSHGDYQSWCRQTRCWGNKRGSAFDIEYWEPSAVIEVSCRSDYSMLKPGGVGTRSEKMLQSCAVNPAGGRRFLEARVWAINGFSGNLRHQSALGDNNGERARQCSEYSDPGDTNAKRYWGYGANKEKTFSHPDSNGSGPGGSWEAYISDKDPAWAMDSGGTSAPSKQGVCKAGSVDIANCWGTMNPTGWVTHMEPSLAAATVAWRAHTKALGMKKVSGAGKGGYKMMMDFPFKLRGAAANEMGISGSGKTGSDCFKPGASGPDWYSGLIPEKTIDKVGQLKDPKLETKAEVNSGIYIFTVWVKTSCRRWTVETKGPGGMCKYEDKS